MDDAITLGAHYGFLRRINSDGVYHDSAFEQALLTSLAAPHPATGDQIGAEVLHVLTKTSPYGGHTRLALEWIRIRTGKERQAVIFTRAADPVTTAALDGMGIAWHRLIGTPTARLSDLMQRHASATTVVLHIHPEDCLGALAAHCLRERGARILFLNHADHLFTFGMSAADTVLEVSGFGWRTTQSKREPAKQSFLGIPLPASGAGLGHRSDAAPEAPRRHAPVLSVGAPFKYDPAAGFDFADFLNKLTSSIANEFHLVGPDGTEPWWRTLDDRARKQVRFFGSLPLDAVRQRMQTCAAYVDSFPLTGGTAFQEAFVLGARAFGLKIGAGGYGLVDALRSNNVDSLIAEIADALGQEPTGDHAEEEQLLRQRIVEEFCDSAISARIDIALAGGTVAIPDEMYDAAGDLDHCEKDWRDLGPALAVLPGELPSLWPRTRLLMAMAACSGGRIEMSRRALIEFAAGRIGS